MKKSAKQAITTALGIAFMLAIFGGAKYWVQEANSAPTIDRTSYVRVAQKSCVSEALKSGVTQYQADTYCKCVIDDIYTGKSVKEMQAMDAEVINGALPEKYDAIIVECASRVQ